MQQSKAKIRQEIKLKLKEWPLIEKNKADEVILSKLEDFSLLLKAQKIGLYYSINYEVDTIRLITRLLLKKKQIFLPRIVNRNLVFYQITNLNNDMDKHHTYWLFEPRDNLPIVSANELDLVIVPMLAFDKDNNRIGYGQGYYDRYLRNVKREKVVGLAYHLQEVPIIEHEPHDQKIFTIITDK